MYPILSGCVLQSQNPEVLKLVQATTSYLIDLNDWMWASECENVNNSDVVFESYHTY